MPLMLLMVVIVIAFQMTHWFVLQPIDWLGWVQVPQWLGLTLIVLGISWCLGD